MRFLSPILPILAIMAVTAPAAAMTASCQAEFEKYSAQRQAEIARINAFNKKRPTAQQACAAFGSLGSVENRMLKWMTENKDWCQIPEVYFEQLKGAAGETNKLRGQICTAARREAAGGGAAPRGAPPPGSGVRLPQGAL